MGKTVPRSGLHKQVTDWGRTSSATWAHTAQAFCILAFCPILVLYIYSSCAHYQCELTPIAHQVWAGSFDKLKIPFSWTAVYLYAGWYVFQVVLSLVLPGPEGFGSITPAGHVLKYNVNGFQAYVLTHLLFYLGGYRFKYFSPTVIYDNWGGLFIVCQIWGYFLSLFVYVKAHLFPSHPRDRKFTGSVLYDFLMGIELNPRIGSFDFKLFHNGRPGIIAWTLIDWSFAAKQYQDLGYVTYGMMLVCFLHAVYVIDFFWREDWYLRTIDICHDHFGFYLAWGDTVWLPYLYTLQSHYVLRNPINLPASYALFVALVGLTGYAIFLAVNNQKDYFRTEHSQGRTATVWGKPAKFINCTYYTAGGESRTTALLISGFWGWSNHFNYLGDLTLSLAMCMSCGWASSSKIFVGYFYIYYMTILLVHRTYRDDQRLKGKYGTQWAQYRKIVPWRICPGLF